MSALEVSIRDLILSYLTGRLEAAELNDKLPTEMELDEAGDDADARRLVARASGYLAGYQAGDRDEDDLRNRLAQVVTPTTDVEYVPTDFTVTTGASVTPNPSRQRAAAGR